MVDTGGTFPLRRQARGTTVGEKETASAEELERRQHQPLEVSRPVAGLAPGAGAASEGRTYDVKTNDRGEAREAADPDDDVDGDGAPEAAINNTKSNLKHQPGGGGGGAAQQLREGGGDSSAAAK